jgi:hypothetical protein
MAGGPDMQIRSPQAARLQGLMLDGKIEQAQAGTLNNRRVEVAQPQPRAQNILDRAWSAISSFVRSLTNAFSRAAPVAAQPRAAGLGTPPSGDVQPAEMGAMGGAGGGGTPRLSVSTQGQLVGEAAQRFEQTATQVSPKLLTPNAEGICEQATKDWGRDTLIIGGQTSVGDRLHSLDLVRQLTGGNDAMLLRISQFANQNPTAAILHTLQSGGCGIQDAIGAALMPGERRTEHRILIDAQADGSVHVKHELGYQEMSQVLDLSSGDMRECDPEQSRMDFSFAIRIATDGTTSMAQPLHYSVQLRSPD